MGTPADTSPPAPAYDESEELAVGAIVGDYRIEKMIGYGGMGVVYGAVHPVIGKRAAVKVLSAKYCADRLAISRFVQEAQAVNRVGHANIVDIFAFGTLDDGRSYLVMEWLQGETLMARLDRLNRLPLAEVIEISIELSRALEAAHAANVIHRDLKPENVILVEQDDGFRIKLLDFGIAKLSTSKPTSDKTATGITMGTPLFMSPEQAKGHNVDARTDIYALGVLMYMMLCGETPFEHEDSPVEVLHAHIGKKPRPPSELEPSIPEAIERLVLDLLAKRLEDRPSLADVRRTLRAISAPGRNSDIITIPGHDSTELVAPRRRSKAWLAAGALAVLAAGLGIALTMRGSTATPVPPPPPPAPAPAPAVAIQPPPPPVTAPNPEPPPIVLGTIELAVEPAGATVTVDGKPVTLDHGKAVVDADPGDHVVAARAPGYAPIDQKLTIASGVASPLKVHLQRPHAATTPKPTHTDTDAVVNPFDHKPKK